MKGMLELTCKRSITAFRIPLHLAMMLLCCGSHSTIANAWDAKVVGIEIDGKMVQSATLSRITPNKQGDLISIQDGFIFAAGAAFVTPANTRLTLKTSNGNIVTVAESSCLRITTGSQAGEEFGVDCGKANFDVLKRLGFFNVRHKTYYAQVEGTKYDVEVIPEKEIRFSVAEGKVRVARPVLITVDEGRREGSLEVSEVLSAGDTKTYRLNAEEYLARFKTFGEAESFYKVKLDEARASGDIKRISAAVNDMGYILLTTSKFKESIPYFEEYQKLSEQRFPGVAGEFWGVISLGNLAVAYANIGGEANLKKAIELDERGLAILRKTFPDGIHQLIATKLNNMGAVYRQLGGKANLERAIRCFSEALEINRKLSPDKANRAIAANLANLGMTRFDLGDAQSRKDATSNLEDALRIRRQLYPDGNHPDVANSLTNLGVVYASSNESVGAQKAIPLHSEALSILRKIYPNAIRTEIATCLTHLAEAYSLLQGDANFRKANIYNNEALDMWVRLSPSGNSTEVVNALNIKGTLATRLGQTKQAIESFEQALQIQKIIVPSGNDALSALTLGNLGAAYGQLPDRESTKKAIVFWEDSLRIRRSATASSSLAEISLCLNNLGFLNYRLATPESIKLAIAYFEEELSIEQKLYPSGIHNDLAISNSSLGNIYSSLSGPENEARSRKYLQEAERIKKALEIR